MLIPSPSERPFDGGKGLFVNRSLLPQDRDWSGVLTTGSIPEVQRISAEHRAILARVLDARRISVPADLEAFFRPSVTRELSLQPLTAMRNFESARATISSWIERRVSVALCADYDVDGTTAAAQFSHLFRATETPHHIFISDRLGVGYGLRPETIDRAVAAGCSALLVLDQGTSDSKAIKHAASRGLEVIIIDHHQVSAEPAALLVNPAHPACGFAGGILCTGGLAFCMVRSLSSHVPKNSRSSLLDEACSLAALGPIADVMPLTGLNRAIVYEGLAHLPATALVGVSALCKEAGLGEVVRASDVAFALAPMMNAASRMAHGSLVTELLTEQIGERAASYASRLGELNRERLIVGRDLMARAREEVLRCGLGSAAGIAVGDSSYHPGVIGIVAQGLVGEFNCAAAVLGRGDAASCTVSMRGPEWFDAQAAMAALGAGLIQGGGHRVAAGGRVPLSRLAEFKSAWAAVCLAQRERAMPTNAPGDTQDYIDLPRGLGGIDNRLIDTLDLLGPFGAGNPAPLWRFPRLKIDDIRVLRGTHLMVDLSDGAQFIRAFLWNRAAHPALARGREVEVVGSLHAESYLGGRQIVLVPHSISASPPVAVSTKQQARVVPQWKVHLVTTDDDLQALCQQLAQRPEIAIDTETVFRSERDHTLCLVQIGDPVTKTNFLVLVRKMTTLAPLKMLLESEKVRKIEHYSRFEAERFSEIGIEQTNIFDTCTEAESLYPYLPDHKLKSLVFLFLGLTISKEEQDSAWDSDELSPEQISYAALDPELTYLLGAVLQKERASVAINAEDTMETLMCRFSKSCARIEQVEGEDPSLAALNERYAMLTDEAERALKRGELPYDGSWGKAHHGKPHYDISVPLFETRFREIFSKQPDLSEALKRCVFVGHREVQALLKKAEILGFELEGAERSALLKRTKVVLPGEPTIGIETKGSRRKTEPVVITNESSRDLLSVMRELHEVERKRVEWYLGNGELRHLYIERAVVRAAIKARVKAGESYKGDWGKAGSAADYGCNLARLLEEIGKRSVAEGVAMHAERIMGALTPFVERRVVDQIFAEWGLSQQGTPSPQVEQLWSEVYRPTGERAGYSIKARIVPEPER